MKLIFFLSALSLTLGKLPAQSVPQDSVSVQPAETYYEPVDIHYKILGSTNKDTTLVFIHGWNLDQSYWTNQLPATGKDYKIVLPDLAGHGSSGKNREHWTVKNFALDIVAIIGREDLRNVILIGHSMGGEIALEVTSMIPERIIGLIAVDTFKDVGFTFTDETQRELDHLMSALRNDYGSQVALMKPHLFGEKIANKNAYARVMKAYRTADPLVAVPIFESVALYSNELKAKLPNLPFKLRIIASDYSPVNEQALAQYTAHGYEIKTIAHSGHFPMIERPEEFNKALKYFLMDIKKGL